MSDYSSRPKRVRKQVVNPFDGYDPTQVISSDDDDFEEFPSKKQHSGTSSARNSQTEKLTQSPIKEKPESINLSSPVSESPEPVPKAPIAKKPPKRNDSDSEDDFGLSEDDFSLEEDKDEDESEFDESDDSFSGKKTTKGKGKTAKKSPVKKAAPKASTAKATKAAPKAKASASTSKAAPKSIAKPRVVLPSVSVTTSVPKGVIKPMLKKAPATGSGDTKIPDGIRFLGGTPGQPKAGLSKLAKVPPLHPPSNH